MGKKGEILAYILGIFDMTKEVGRTSVSVGYDINETEDNNKELTLIPQIKGEWRIVLRGISVPLHEYHCSGSGFRTQHFLYNSSLTDEEILRDGLDTIAPELCGRIYDGEGNRFVITDDVASYTDYKGIDPKVSEAVWNLWSTPEFAKEYEKIKPFEIKVPFAKPIPPEMKTYLKKNLEELLKQK